MIASLEGKVELKDDPYIIVQVGGVGYKVLVSSKISSNFQNGSTIKLFTYTHVREDALDLFGFLEYEDLKLFELLISVSGVGPKTAVNIFSLGGQKEIVSAIQKGDVDFFTGIPRLGKKNAQKIIIELKSKLGDTSTLNMKNSNFEGSDEVLGALMSFGFSRVESHEAIRKTGQDGKTIEEKIKLALKQLGK